MAWLAGSWAASGAWFGFSVALWLLVINLLRIERVVSGKYARKQSNGS